MSYRLTPQAAADVEHIADFVAQHSPKAASALVNRLHSRWELLATQPRSGAPRDDLAPGIRHAVVGNLVSFYFVVGSEIEIVRVLHGRRDITGSDFAAAD